MSEPDLLPDRNDLLYERDRASELIKSLGGGLEFTDVYTALWSNCAVYLVPPTAPPFAVSVTNGPYIATIHDNEELGPAGYDRRSLHVLFRQSRTIDILPRVRPTYCSLKPAALDLVVDGRDVTIIRSMIERWAEWVTIAHTRSSNATLRALVQPE